MKRRSGKPGDRVIVQPPVYNSFFSSIRNHGCEIVSNELIRDRNTYRMDFDDLEQKAADPHAKPLLLCNPHTPAGRVWTKEKLQHAGEIGFRQGVFKPITRMIESDRPRDRTRSAS